MEIRRSLRKAPSGLSISTFTMASLSAVLRRKQDKWLFRTDPLTPESTRVPPWEFGFLPGAATEGEALNHRSTEVTRGAEAKLEEKVRGITGPSLAANVCQQPLAEKKSAKMQFQHVPESSVSKGKLAVYEWHLKSKERHCRCKSHNSLRRVQRLAGGRSLGSSWLI